MIPTIKQTENWPVAVIAAPVISSMPQNLVSKPKPFLKIIKQINESHMNSKPVEIVRCYTGKINKK